jgi:hypothetical protein
MLITLMNLVVVAAGWPWLEPITVLAHAASALLGLGVAIHRTIRCGRPRCYEK